MGLKQNIKDVIESLKVDPYTDPLYGICIDCCDDITAGVSLYSAISALVNYETGKDVLFMPNTEILSVLETIYGKLKD